MRKNIPSGGSFESVFGYSRAVSIGGQIHVSGTCASAGNEDKDAYGQAKVALAIIEKALKDAGSGFTEVVRTVVYVTDMADADLVAKAHCETFGDIRPASTLVQVVRLFRPWQKVEIEAYAILGAGL
jgi:enamine deaminase RidA (YjgF/YER057c/UK114 family)